MKSLLLVLILLISHFDSFGQQKTDLSQLSSILPTSLQENVRELKEQKVDTIYIYYRYCTGCEMPTEPEECQGFLDARVVWRKEGKTYSKRVDCKNTKQEVQQSSSLALDYFIDHSVEITNSELIRKTKGDKGKVVYLQRGPVHHHGEQFTLILKDDVYTSSLTDYLKENAEKTNSKWVKATSKLADLNQKDENKE
jgi:hypothetical protein